MQRMQETEDQVQWPDTMAAVWESVAGMPLCAQLLRQQLQGLGRVQANDGPDILAPAVCGLSLLESEFSTKPGRQRRLSPRSLAL
jgi:hypothetical protein